MFPTLTHMDNDTLTSHILIAMVGGGFRVLDDGPGTEYLNDTARSTAVVLTNPSTEDWGPDYVYVKRFDGSVMWRSTLEAKWNFTEEG